MKTRVGINGFGRIGRQVLRAIMSRHSENLEVVAINDLTDTATNAHLFKYDSNYGIFPGEITPTATAITIDGMEIQVLSERDPAQVPWQNVGVDIVIESTGFFTDAKVASGHLNGGAKKIIISAPATNEDLTVVLGVNEDKYEPSKHQIISNASCTTNCIAPMAKILNDNFGVEAGLMSTIHAYTNDQKILDQVHDDLRRARAAAENIIPTSTGAARAVGLVLPELNGKLNGMAFRVPTSTGSVTDLVVNLNTEATSEEINQAFEEASNNKLKGILQYCDEPLVSSDFIQNPHSCIIDAPSTMTINSKMVKVVGWYDNEWGYSCRTSDLASFIAQSGM